MAFPSSSRLLRLSATSSAINTAEMIPLVVDSNGLVSVSVQIVRVKVKRASGAVSANFTPRIFSSSTGAAADISQEYNGANTLVANLHESGTINLSCKTDTAGKLYLQIAPNVGLTDTFSYQVDVIVQR